MRLRHLTALLPAALLLALGTGPGDVGLGEALRGVLAHLGLGDPLPPTRDAIVWQLRLPRALLAALVGAALACAGALTQGLFRNPLADPGILGVSAGAMLAAVIGFVLGAESGGLWVTPLLAAAGASLVLLVLLALHRAHQSLATLLLSGFALGTLCAAAPPSASPSAPSAGTSACASCSGASAASRAARGSTSPGPSRPAPPASLLAGWLRRDLDTLHLGHDVAASLGVDLGKLRRRAVLAIGLLVGTATAISGVIGFVGLLVPHLARMHGGPGHRRLLPRAALLGAVLVLLVDTLARAVTSVILPPGVLTSLLGAPLFLWLLRRRGLAESLTRAVLQGQPSPRRATGRIDMSTRTRSRHAPVHPMRRERATRRHPRPLARAASRSSAPPALIEIIACTRPYRAARTRRTRHRPCTRGPVASSRGGWQ
jgi:iron complex transport system permease protein